MPREMIVTRAGSPTTPDFRPQARYYFGMNPDPTPAEIQQVAQYYPVFRIVHDGG
jgi:hypothetical protein